MPVLMELLLIYRLIPVKSVLLIVKLVEILLSAHPVSTLCVSMEMSAWLHV